MHKGFDVPQLRASEEWYVFIGHEYISTFYNRLNINLINIKVALYHINLFKIFFLSILYFQLSTFTVINGW